MVGDVGDLGDRVEGDLDEDDSEGESGGPRGEQTGEKTESSLGLRSILIVGGPRQGLLWEEKEKSRESEHLRELVQLSEETDETPRIFFINYPFQKCFISPEAEEKE